MILIVMGIAILFSIAAIVVSILALLEDRRNKAYTDYFERKAKRARR